MTLTVHDIFCGAGGSSQGAENAGSGQVRLALGLNHDRLSISTHSANFPHAEHDCADASLCDPRYYPPADLLIASPECTNHSLAKGVSKKLARRSLFDHPDPTAERSRATMWDVVRFLEAHRYQAAIIENVVDARDWELFEAWINAVRSVRPGYEAETVYLNSMVCWPTPQSRDRLYTIIWRRGAPRPNLKITPPCWCWRCEQVVEGVQSWRNPRRPWGKYRQNYWYRCPACTEVTAPLAAPAATAIDWTLEAPRIGDRRKPLAAGTIHRIEAGLERYARGDHREAWTPVPLLVQVAGNTFQRPGSTCRVRPVTDPIRTQTGTLSEALLIPVNGNVQDPTGTGRRCRSAAEPYWTQTADRLGALLIPLERNKAAASKRAHAADEPLRTQTARRETGITIPPFMVELRGRLAEHPGGTCRPLDQPAATVIARGNQHWLAIPPGWLVANFGNGSDPHKFGWVRSVEEPTGSITTRDHHGFLVPSGGTWADRAAPTDGPAPTFTTKESYGLAELPPFLVPYNRTGNPKGIDEPARTVTTHDREGLVAVAVPEVDDCGYRMLQPHEIQAAMAFAPNYIVLGDKRAKVKQLGNAVTPPVMELLMRRVLESLGAAA